MQTGFELVDQLGHLVELDGHSALLVGRVVLMQQTLGSSLIDSLNSHLVGDIGLVAVAFRHRYVKLLQVGLELGLLGLILSGLGSIDQHTLLGRLNVGQTKHLLRYSNDFSARMYILSSDFRNCNTFFNFFVYYIYIRKK